MNLFYLRALILPVSVYFIKAAEIEKAELDARYKNEGMEPLTGAFDHFKGNLTVERGLVLASENPNALIYGMTTKTPVEVVERVLADGLLDVNAFDRYGRCSLMYALSNNDFDAAEALIANGADVNAFDFSTPLVVLAGEGNLKAVKFLLDHGADIHSTGRSGFTVLVFAAQGGNPELVQVLLDLGLDVNGAEAATWRTPLHSAVSSSHGSLAIIKLLVENGADLGMKTADGDTVMHIAACSLNLEIFEYLLQVGGTHLLQQSNSNGKTVLDICNGKYCYRGQEKAALIAKYL